MKKRLLCSLLAVMMLISMLAGIVLPVSAEVVSTYPRYTKGASGTTFSISAPEDWIALTEYYKGKACSLTLYVTNDIVFDGNTNMLPLSSNNATFSGTIYGQGFAFRNILIDMTGGTGNYEGVALIGALNKGKIYDLGLTGTVYNRSTSASAHTAAFSGGRNTGAGALIKNCWSDVYVKGPSGTNTKYLGVFYAHTENNYQGLENCINYGTIESTSTNGGAGGFYAYGGSPVMKNCLDLGTVVANGSGVAGSVIGHFGQIQNFINSNSYAVNHNLWGVTANNVNEVSTTMPDGTAITSAQQVHDYLAVSSAAEAAWKATNGANGEVYYKLDDTMGVTYGSATDRVQKVTATGLVNKAFYFNNGDQITAADFTNDPNASIFVTSEGYEDAIKDGVLTVPNADITIRVGVPYSQKSTCSNASSTVWTISTKTDWINLTNDYAKSSCNLKLYVTNDIEFDPNEVVKPLGYCLNGFTGLLDGQGYTFKNINITHDGDDQITDTSHGFRYGVALVGALNGATIQNLGITGTVTNEGVNERSKTAVFVGGKHNGGQVNGVYGLIKNCWSSVTVSGPSSATENWLAVFYAYPQHELAIENCINYGKVISTTGGPASVFFAPGGPSRSDYCTTGVLENCLDLSSAADSCPASIVTSHTQLQDFVGRNNYSVKDLWSDRITFDASQVTAKMPDGSAITSVAQVNNYYKAGSAAEAAWKATDGANGEVYYKLKNGKVTFGTATDRVQKITFTGYEGFDGKNYYLNVGDGLDLDDLRMELGVDGDFIYTIVEEVPEGTNTNNYITVPNKDITINVTLDDRAMAKQELQAIYDVRKDYDPKYFVEGDALAQWKTDAATVLAMDTPTMNELSPLLATATNMSLDLKDGAYLPYSKKALYSVEINTNKTWGIETKADWMAWVDESTTTANSYSGYTFHVTADIDFEDDEMLPIGYGKYRFEGMLDGHNHVFSGINIRADGGTSTNNVGKGLGLISDVTGGAAGIRNLGLASGTVTSVSGAGKNEIGSFAGYSKLAKITGCWSALTLSIPMEGNGVYAGGIAGETYNTIINGCYFIGNFENAPIEKDTACGIVGYGETIAGTVRNCFAATQGVSGLIGLHPNAFAAGVDFNAKSGSINSYTIGFQAFDPRHTGDSAYNNVFINHADAIAAFEAKYRLNANAYKSGELAYKLTEGSAASGVYFTVKNNKTVFGTEAERAKRITVADGGVNTYYYGFEGDVIEVIAPATGKVAVDEAGNILESTSITLGASDIVITHKDFEEVDEVFLKKTELQGVIDSYKTFNPEFIQNWDEVVAWFDTAAAVIADPFATKAQVQGQINRASTLPKFVTFTYPNYPALKDYELYNSFVREFSINDKEDWLKLVNISTTNSHSFSGYKLHVTNDIDFENTQMLPVGYGKSRFEGHLDGHGHVFTNINVKANGGSGKTGVGLFCDITGAYAGVKNLGLASGKITSTSTSTSKEIGSFAGFTKSATISNCWSALTLSIPMGKTNVYAGGLFGQLQEASSRIEGCYFIGKFDAAPGAKDTVGGIVGYGETKAGTVRNCFAYATNVSGLNNLHQNAYSAGFSLEKIGTVNSYSIGFQAFDMRHTGETAYTAVFENNADAIAAFEAQYRLDAAAYADGTLAYKLNEGSAASNIFFTVKNGKTVLGSATDKVVKITVGEDSYYLVTGEKMTVTIPDGNVIVATGDAKVDGSVITAGTTDTIITFADDEASTLADAKRQLQNLLDQYSAREEKYFTSDAWTSYQNWINTANTALDGELSAITAAITAGKALNMAKATTLAYPDYPSVADYDAYKDTAVKHFAVGTKDEWLAAVALSNREYAPDAAASGRNFVNVTIHLTADIDMNNEQMLPLCYGASFGGKLDGHGYVFKNINIDIKNPVGSVGLVSKQYGNELWVCNLGIESGSIKVSGTNSGSTAVGGFVGTVQGDNTYIQKCWNAADITVENGDHVGGIAGYTTAGNGGYNMIDRCFNLGDIAAGGGIVGYGLNKAKVYNCFNAGKASYAVKLAQAVYNDDGTWLLDAAALGEMQNCWSLEKNVLTLNGAESGSAKWIKARALNSQSDCNTLEQVLWMVNQNYVPSGMGDTNRTWFTIDAEGMVRYGSAYDQVRKVTVMVGGKVAQTYYAAPGATIELSGEVDLTYFVQDGATSVLKGNMLTMGHEDVTVTAQSGVYMGDADNNGSVTLFDAITVLRGVVGLAELEYEAAGDVNQNGRLDANDAVLIARNWLGDPNVDYVIREPLNVDGQWLKVASYNIKSLAFDGTYNVDSGDRKAEVIAVLEEADADIVGLQEVDGESQVRELADALGYQYYDFTNVNYWANTESPYIEQYGHAVMSRYPITVTDEVVYEVQVGEGNVRTERRTYTRVEVNVDGAEGADLIWYNTHLQGYTEQFTQLIGAMETDRAAGKKVVMTADLNLEAKTLHNYFDASKFTALNGGDDGAKTISTTVDCSNPDNILVSDNMEFYWDNTLDIGLKVVDRVSTEGTCAGLTASDHSLIYGYICV